MSLTLEHFSRVVEGQTWIDDVNLRFEAGSFNVLLGRTLSGKTSLMRLMAGLDKPDSGRILIDRKSTRLNSSHTRPSRMPSSA